MRIGNVDQQRKISTHPPCVQSNSRAWEQKACELLCGEQKWAYCLRWRGFFFDCFCFRFMRLIDWLSGTTDVTIMSNPIYPTLYPSHISVTPYRAVQIISMQWEHSLLVLKERKSSDCPLNRTVWSKMRLSVCVYVCDVLVCVCVCWCECIAGSFSANALLCVRSQRETNRLRSQS